MQLLLMESEKSIAIGDPICYNIHNKYINNAGGKMDDFTSRVNLQKIIDEKKLTTV